MCVTPITFVENIQEQNILKMVPNCNDCANDLKFFVTGIIIGLTLQAWKWTSLSMKIERAPYHLFWISPKDSCPIRFNFLRMTDDDAVVLIRDGKNLGTLHFLAQRVRFLKKITLNEILTPLTSRHGTYVFEAKRMHIRFSLQKLWFLFFVHMSQTKKCPRLTDWVIIFCDEIGTESTNLINLS